MTIETTLSLSPSIQVFINIKSWSNKEINVFCKNRILSYYHQWSLSSSQQKRDTNNKLERDSKLVSTN